MFKELKIMKTLRYLLIVAMISMASVLSVAYATAQNLAQQPQMEMQSTSVMQGSGSALPQAAVTGSYMTGSTPGTYSPASSSGPHRSNRGGGFNPGDEPGPGDNDEPWADPIGDGVWALLACACAYLLVRVFLKRKRA